MKRGILATAFECSKPFLVLLVPILILVAILQAVVIKIKIINNSGGTLYAVGSLPNPSSHEYDVPSSSQHQLVILTGPEGFIRVFASTTPERSNRTQFGVASFDPPFTGRLYCRFEFEFQPDGKVAERGGCPF